MLEGRQLLGANNVTKGEVFGRYRLRRVLGQGGMGRLYVAEQIGIEGFSKIVALKVILPHLADSSHFRSMFLNEGRVAARLEHPNIVATYELGEVDGKYFISMEYLSGEDLSAVLSRCQVTGPMSLEIAAALAQQCANGLHYAHEMRDSGGRKVELVHRDVNPLNIFVTYYGMAKLLDFGIVKDAADTSKTMPGVFKGKYAYSAPEQLEGGQVDRRTDLFCLGIVLWECLTGRRLFHRSTDAGTIDAVRGEEVPPPSTFRPDVPRELDDIVLRALVRDRRGRFQTGHAMSEALDKFLLQRQSRPTSKSIGIWLESLFGSERATLKKAIAQGSEVEADLTWLPEADGSRPGTRESSGGGKIPRPVSQPKALWSSTLGSHGGEAVAPVGGAPSTPLHLRAPDFSGSGVVTAPSQVSSQGSSGTGSLSIGGIAPSSYTSRANAAGSASRRASKGVRPVMVIAIAAVLGLAVFVGVSIRAAFRGTSSEGTPAHSTMGALDIRSDPPGAQIFADGDPTGLTTPAVLTGLRPGRSVEIRLDKVGYAPVTQMLEVQAGTHLRSFPLTPAAGTLRFDGLPASATVYVDDGVIEVHGPLLLPFGQHRLRVENSSGVLLSQTIDIGPGQQTVRVGFDKKEERGR